MLDPAGGRKMLREFLLRAGGDRDVAAEHDGARGCGTLIDGQHERHEGFSWRCFPGVGVACAKATGLGVVRHYGASARSFLPSPLAGEGGEIDRSEMQPNEGSASAETDHSPGAKFATLIRDPPSPQELG